MIKIKDLTLTNFLSHVDSHIDFSEYSGLTLIEGITSDGRYSSNGAGKSTILEGLFYALKGSTLRKVLADDIINRNYGKDMKVSLGFSLADGNYVVSRYRKDSLKGNKIELFKNNEDISSRLDKGTQTTLDEILDIDQNVLMSTMLLGEGLSSRFTQLTDPEKKSLIESTLNLPYSISGSRTSANSKLKTLKENKSNLEGQLSTIQRFLSVDVEVVKDSLPSLSSDIESLEKYISDIQKDITGLNESTKPILQSIQVLSEALQKISNLKYQYDNLSKEEDNLHREINKVISNEITSCPLCRQLLGSEESKASIIATHESSIKELLSKKQVIEEELKGLPDQTVLSNKKNLLQEELNSISSKVNSFNAEFKKSTDKLHDLKSSLEFNEMTLKNYDEYSKESDSLKKDIASVKEEISIYEYLSNLFSPTGLQTLILEEAIDYINKRLSVYSDILLDKSYQITFKKGKVDLLDNGGSTYQSLSNGEKRRLDICIQFSLHDYVSQYCGIELDSLFIDEVLDTLDSVGVSNIIEVLRLKMEYCGLSRVFVITHNNDLKESFDSVLTVVKDINGNSTIKN